MDRGKLGNLVRVLGWPVVAIVALWLLHPAISDVIRQGEVRLEIDGFKVTTQSAADQWNRQILDLQNRFIALERRMASVREPFMRDRAPSFAAPLSGAPSQFSTGTDTGALNRRIRKILWVDDQPQNNAYEIYALSKDGVQVKTAKSTSAALDVLKEGQFKAQAIITDLGRTQGGRYEAEAGLTLIKEARKAGFEGPIIVYTTSKRATNFSSKVDAAGGSGTTSSPTTLLEMIKSYGFQSG